MTFQTRLLRKSYQTSFRLKKVSHSPVENAVVYVTMNASEADHEKNKLPVIQTTDPNGIFSVTELNFTGERLISAKANDKDGSDRIRVVLNNQFSDLPDSYPKIPQTVSLSTERPSAKVVNQNKLLAERSKVNRSTTEPFVDYQMEGELDEIVVIEEGLGEDWVASYFEDASGAVSRIKPSESDHLRDLNIEQLLHQLPGVRYNYITEELSIREGRYRPLIYVDGVEVDTQALIAISANDIETITVSRSVADLAIFGVDGAGGAIIVETKSGGGVQGRVRGLATKWIQGYQNPTSFYSPKYGITVPQEIDVQDQRITLHWEPQIDLSESPSSISFWTNDVPSTYRVVLQGITDSGIPFHETTTFTIEP